MLVKKDTQSKKLHHIDVDFQVKQITESDEEFFIFEGLASTFGNIDLVDDIIEAGAFAESLTKKLPVILWMHNVYEPIGMPIEVRETSEGLFVKARLPRVDTLVSGRIIPQMKVGSIRRMSIGFRILAAEPDADRPSIRRIFKVNLEEISLVTLNFAANPQAEVTDFKSNINTELPIADREYEWNASDAIERIKKASGSEDKPSPDYRKSFLWFDDSKPDDFNSYKFPIVDYIDGKAHVIPNALTIAKSRLASSSITESHKPDVLKAIEDYETVLNKAQPKPFYNVSDVQKITDKRSFEKALRESGSFSKDAATALVAKVQFEERGEPVTDELKGLEGKLDDMLVGQGISNILNKHR